MRMMVMMESLNWACEYYYSSSNFSLGIRSVFICENVWEMGIANYVR